MAWAKSRFEEYFNAQVELVAHLRGIISPAADTGAVDATAAVNRARAWLYTLSGDQLSGLLKVLQHQPWTSEGATKVIARFYLRHDLSETLRF